MQSRHLTMFMFRSIFGRMTRVIRTLGQAARHGMLVRAECPACDRKADFFANDLCGFFGFGREIDTLPFRCGACGMPAKRIRALAFPADERARKVVWRPVTVK